MLRGVKVLEFAGLAPGPFCGMILSDFGAQVTRIDRPPKNSSGADFLARGKRSMSVDLKNHDAVETLLKLSESHDVIIDPFRPGVMEKLGLGPDVVLKRNPRVIYARLTGFGQTGACASLAGHDINYLSLSGALSLFGRSNETPFGPVNLLADFAAGGMMCAMGVIGALFERSSSGKGQVVDSAMVDGVSYLSSFVHNFSKNGLWGERRGENLLDGGAPFYDTYKTLDGKFVAVGSLEPQFYALLLKGLGLPAEMATEQMDRSTWPKLRETFTKIFLSHPRSHWEKVFGGTDACVTPVLELGEIDTHPFIESRGLLSQGGNIRAAPRFSRTQASNPDAPQPQIGEHSVDVLTEAGFDPAAISSLLKSGAVVQSQRTAKL